MISAVYFGWDYGTDLLSGLLLAVDGSAVCGRRDESRMVGCVNRIHRPRKSRAGRIWLSRVTGLLLIGGSLWVIAEAVLWR
jgi:hypothetical protein